MSARPKPTKQDTHPDGRIIEFFEDDHRYVLTDDASIEFTSATTWIGKFFPEFDRENISKRYAQKHGMLQEDVLAMWDEKSRVARERGTLVHAKAEDLVLSYLQTNQVPDLESITTDENDDGISNNPQLTRQLIASMHDAVSKMTEVLDLDTAERIVFSPELQLSGMVDLVVKLRTENGTPLIGIYDWKTNEKITRHNPWRNGLPPIQHLSDCNFVHYSLQLNLYEYICRREGYFDPETRFQKVLIHLTPEGYQTHKCENLQHTIEQMMEHSFGTTHG